MFASKNKSTKPAPNDIPMSAREEWSDFFKTALIAVFLALLVRSFLFEPFNIPSSSMKPTLLIGDYLFVNKPAYGYSRYSFPFGLVPIYGRLPAGKTPQQGDIVVFKLPSNTGVDFIKRVIGMPGDRVQVVDGRLYINRTLVPRDPLGLRRVEERDGTMTVMEYIETLPNGTMHRIYEIDDRHPLDDTEEFVVPPGHYFVMGDNRDNSQDSRVQNLVGFVPHENLVGRASFLFFSTNGYANLGEVWKWPKTIRYDRLFMSLEPVRLDPPAPEKAGS
jgi:signal peptidase I